MRIGKLLGGALFAAGLMFAGCGGAQAGEVGAEELASREDAAPNCNGVYYEHTYYSDETHMNIVGFRGCDCAYWSSFGRTSAFVESYYGTCR